MLQKICLVVVILNIWAIHTCVGSIYQDTQKINTTDKYYYESCLKDASLGNVDGNYDFSCLTDTSIEAGRTKCCKEPGSNNKGCCDEGTVKGMGDPQKMIKIITILVVCTVCLMIFVFVCTWCDKKTFPCLEKLEIRIKGCWEKMEEHMPCCDKRVNKRNRQRDLEEQGGTQFDMPTEYNQPITDEFWGGPTGAIDDTPIVSTQK